MSMVTSNPAFLSYVHTYGRALHTVCRVQPIITRLFQYHTMLGPRSSVPGGPRSSDGLISYGRPLRGTFQALCLMVVGPSHDEVVS